MTVITGLPAAAVSPAKSGRSVTTPEMGLYRFEMLPGNLMRSLGLNQGSLGSIQIAAWDRSFGKQLRPAVRDALSQVEVGSRLAQVCLCLHGVFGYGGPGGDVVGTLSRRVSPLVVECSSFKVAVFQGCEQLTGPDA